MGYGCTLLTSPPTFEPVKAGTYEVVYSFSRFLLGPLGSLLRHRPRLRWTFKALAYPKGVWRTYRALKQREPGMLHIHEAVIPPLDALLIRALRRRGWRVVYLLMQPLPKDAWSRWKYGRLMKYCDVIAMHEQELAARLRVIYPQFAARIRALTHGTDLPEPPSAHDRESARAALGIAPGDQFLLFFGMIKPYKGIEELLDAMPAVLARSPRVRLCIAGEPLMDMRGVLEKIAALPAGTALLHLQFVPQADVDRFFAAADLVVACYREIPASGVVLQAQSYGRPVLATRVGALPALLEDGRSGFLAGDDIAESILDALADPERLEQKGQCGRQRVERLHSWESVAAETLRLYRIKGEADAAPPQ